MEDDWLPNFQRTAKIFPRYSAHVINKLTLNKPGKWQKKGEVQGYKNNCAIFYFLLCLFSSCHYMWWFLRAVLGSDLWEAAPVGGRCRCDLHGGGVLGARTLHQRRRRCRGNRRWRRDHCRVSSTELDNFAFPEKLTGNFFLKKTSRADLGFPVRVGTDPQRRRRQPYILFKISQKPHEIEEKKLAPREDPLLHPPISRNSTEQNFQLKDAFFLKTFSLKQLVSGHNSALDFFPQISWLKMKIEKVTF